MSDTGFQNYKLTGRTSGRNSFLAKKRYLYHIISWKFRILNEKPTMAKQELSTVNEKLESYRNQLEEAEESLKYKSNLEKLITGISTRFFNLPADKIDENIEKSLHEICIFTNTDAGFLAEINNIECSLRVTHSHSNGKIRFDTNYHGTYAIADAYPWLEKVKKRDCFLISSKEDMPDIAFLKDSLAQSGMTAMLLVPIKYMENIVGFTGYSSAQPGKIWSQDEMALLKVMGETFKNALARKTSETTLTKSEERFRSIVQYLTDIILIIDRDVKITYESPASWKVLGYDPGFLIGKPGIGLVHPEDMEMANLKLKEVFLNRNTHQPTELRIKHRDGHWVPLEFIANNMLDHSAIRGIILTCRDVSERKRVEKALKISESKFRNIFNHSSAAIIILSNDYSILEVNEVFLKLTGYTTEEVKKMKLMDLVTDKYLPQVAERISRYFHHDSLPVFEAEIKGKSNRIIPVEINSKLIDFDGEIALVSIIRDITDRRQLEARILDAVISTEEREREKFARNLHDELGPLLSSIKMYVNSLSAGMEKQKYEFVISQLKKILTEAIESTKEISNDLSPHVLTNYGLLAALEWFLGKFNPYVSIVMESNLGDTRFASSVEISMYRIIKELINNTIKHARAGSITIRLHRVIRSVHLDYADDGVGFPEKWQNNLESMGMGMSNIMSRCRSIGAVCKFYNHAPRGMSFELEVPIEPKVS